MGCHTWFKKQSRYSLNELREMFIKQKTAWVKHWEEVTKDPNHKDRQDDGVWGKNNYNYSQEQFNQFLRYDLTYLTRVKRGHIKYGFLEHLDDTDEGSLYEFVNGVVYVDDGNMPHDIFRLGGYPSTKLHSLEQTIAFCKRKKIPLTNDQMDRLTNFWNNNPIGMIDFG